MERKVIVNDLQSLTVKQIGKGQNSKCYLTENDKYVFKHIHNPDELNLVRLSKFYSSHFVFPRVLVYKSDGQLVGYLMEYIDGNTLDKLPAFVSLEKYSTEVERIEREIEVLTCYRLRLRDMGRTNMIYTHNDELKVVDTDFYIPRNKSKRLYLANMTSFAYGVMSPLTDISEPRFKNDTLNKYANHTISGRMKPSDLIYELKSEAKKKGIEDISTVGDFNKVLRLL